MVQVILSSVLIICFSCIVILQEPVLALADLNFAAVGDWGCTSNTVSTVANIDNRNPEVVFGLGDYSYHPTGTCWFNYITPIETLMKISIGNHEDDSNEGFGGYMSQFELSQTYYSYNYQNVHVLVLDTDRNSFSPGSSQYNFAVNDLETASEDPTIDWIITYFHKPIYTSPSFSSLTSFREAYHPLFDQYGVDLVLQGHFHNYQRTYPLSYNPDSPSNPIVTSSAENHYKDPDAPIFAIVGTGGINLHALSGQAPFVSNQQDDFFGQLDIKITDNGNKLEGKFYRNGDSAILDSFSIEKTSEIPGGYNYGPSLGLTGTNYQDVPSSPSLQLSEFSVAAWFKTSTNFGTNAFIVNKGGTGSDSSGQNQNYGIWMTSSEKIVGGFEAVGGADNFVTSTGTYNDGQWHYAVVTYDGSTVRLYIDGAQVGSKSTGGASPETSGTKPVRIGANSRVTPPTTNFFTGEVDEVRVWNNDLTAQQVADAFAGTSFNAAQQVIYLPFSVIVGYNYGPSLGLTGTNYQDVPSSPSLQLSEFSVAAWFKTSTNFGTNAFIVNKGGTGSDSTGQNQNYGIWMSSSEKIQAGFEAVGGADHFVTSTSTYNDGQWHYAVVTYDGSTVRLYIDGAQVGSKSTGGASPETSGTKPVRIGANSRVTPSNSFFTGEIDEVRIWNNDLTAQQVADAFEGSIVTTGQVLYLGFTNTPPIAYSQDVNTNKNNPISITLTATDSDNESLNYVVLTPPKNGTLSGTPPNLTYNPNSNYVGDDFFTFKANDGTLDSNRATVSIIIRDPEAEIYDYAPGLVLTGSDYHDVSSSPSLQLTEFSVAAWFKTSSDYVSNAYIVNKGGSGSDGAGQNQNYGIAMASSERIIVGFETSSGADQFVTSINAYNDGQWHYAVVTYDGSNVRLYIDGVQVGSKSTGGASPETSGTKPVRVGANSRVTPPTTNFFTGEVDEVRVWNDDLTAQQVADAFAGTSFNEPDEVLYLDFSSVSSTTYHYGPSLSLSGP